MFGGGFAPPVTIVTTLPTSTTMAVSTPTATMSIMTTLACGPICFQMPETCHRYDQSVQETKESDSLLEVILGKYMSVEKLDTE